MHHHEENDPVDSETFDVGMRGVGIKGGHSSPDLMQENERATGVNNLKILQASAEVHTQFSFLFETSMTTYSNNVTLLMDMIRVHVS
jgi:hypothetical protein